MSFLQTWLSLSYPAEVPCQGGLVLVEMGAGPTASLDCGAAAVEEDSLFFCLLPSGNVAKLI